MIASHIVPWKDSSDQERRDVNNGILLSPTYDALFDKHLISFDDTGSIIISSKIKKLGWETKYTSDESVEIAVERMLSGK